MIDLYKNYFFIFLHPIRSLKFTVEKEVVSEYPDSQSFSLVKSHPDGKELTLQEAILLSWPFYFISVFYKLIYNTYFHIYFKNFSIDNSLISEITSSFRSYFIIYENYSLLFKFVFFPLALLFYFKIWSFVISMTTEIIAPSRLNENTEQIITHSFVSHIFLLIPVLGTVLVFISHLVFIFIGVRNSLKLGRIQAIFIILAPLILMLLFFFLMFILYSFMFFLV